MHKESEFHVVTVGWGPPLLEGLVRELATKTGQRFSHILHPRFLPGDLPPFPGLHYVRDDLRQPLPEPDLELLAWLEQPGVPTVHNMILGDRIVATVDYRDAQRWATLLARRTRQLLEELRPSVVIGAFDAIHGGIGLAVAKRMNIPWFALNFTVLPPGLACFCDQMSPAARVQMHTPDPVKLRARAEEALTKFETRSVQARAYMTPPGLSLVQQLASLPRRLSVVTDTVRRSRLRPFIQFTQDRTDYSLKAAIRHLGSVRAARKALANVPLVADPPKSPFILFGLHMQPESSIDVWAPFYANQMWVIELLARSIPPSHKLLVKIHKSDAAKYSAEQLQQMLAYPGVELVQPFTDARRFVESADLLIAIQGTMALEAALLGKPVIMLADSATTLMPSVSQSGDIAELPALIRKKLAEKPPGRAAIIEGLVDYLRPFMPASYNDWDAQRSQPEIDGYVDLFKALETHLRRARTLPLAARS